MFIFKLLIIRNKNKNKNKTYSVLSKTEEGPSASQTTIKGSVTEVTHLILLRMP